MIKRRAAAAGLPPSACCHTFRATGITAYLSNGGAPLSTRCRTSGPGGAPRNKLGFALQLCVLRHPGHLLVPGEFVPPAVVEFIGR